MQTSDRIKAKAKEIYIQRYGSRKPAELSTAELEKVSHDAAVEIQKEIRAQSKGR